MLFRSLHPAIANLSPDRLAKGLYWQRSWNVVTGCSHVSPGCDNCWCEREAARMARHPNPKISGRFDHAIVDGKWSEIVRLNDEALDLPLRTRKPTVFAVWTDLFHPGLDFEDIDKVFAVMALAPQHLFLVLTKRPDEMCAYLTQHGGDSAHWADHFADVAYRVCGHSDNAECVVANAINGMLARGHNVGWPMRHVILMTTIENQPWADDRMPHMMELAGMGWQTGVSIEPMLGPVNLDYIYPASSKEPSKTCGTPWGHKISALHGTVSTGPGGPKAGRCEYGRLSWVIVGGESGPHARPMHPNWVRSLRDQCQAAGVPYFMKQWGEWMPKCCVAYYKENGREYPKSEGRAILNDGRCCLLDPPVNPSESYLKKRGLPLDLESGRSVVADSKAYADAHKIGLEKLGYQWMYRVGKHAAGRLLDGQTHDAFPEIKA